MLLRILGPGWSNTRSPLRALTEFVAARDGVASASTTRTQRLAAATNSWPTQPARQPGRLGPAVSLVGRVGVDC